MADPLDALLQTLAAFTFAVGLILAIGLLLDPNDYPRDRPAPQLAAYTTCPNP